ncbi:PIG-L family deacetylase [Comamonas sp. w2-DMI]|uniref:PIG-L family deacetylase n=1 Tax=Comamonas sp. w2-DMI TaxID=3126391 RepID=UPI0032E3CD84
MLDRYAKDTPDYALGRLNLQAGQNMLCLAPHPDDEVLGCAGLLLKAQSEGLHVESVIVTAGQAGVELGEGMMNPRLAESRAAAQVLGLPEPRCWQLPDRQLRYALPLIERIAQTLQQQSVHWLLLPALTEPHPDHQVLALAGMAAARGLASPVEILFYEVGAPSQPNVLVDISEQAERKWQALACFASQEERHSYLRLAQNMAQLRAFGQADMQAAEAFWHLPSQALHQASVMAELAYWPLQRNRLGLASEPAQQPLVSVLIRSMNRPSLFQAVVSIAQQTYANIEVLVINASGGDHPIPPYPAQRMGLRVIDPGLGADGGLQPLGRSAAANLGLQSVQGDFALFLDDDDLLEPGHIDRLVNALQSDGQAVASYTGVRVEGVDGQWLRDYDLPWDARRLRGINYLPIHAVLFRLRAVAQTRARFDEDLPVLEDWDFWCQLSQQGRFVHVPGVSAIYRQGLGDSHLSDPQHANHWARWHLRILKQHALRWGSDQQSEVLAWHALALNQTELAHEQTCRDRAQLNAQLSQAQLQLQETQQRLQQTELQCLHIQAEWNLAQRSLELLQQSRPVRLARALRRMLGLHR